MARKKKDTNQPKEPCLVQANGVQPVAEKQMTPRGFLPCPQKVPNHGGAGKFPIIGLGASAGGLDAFQGFFSNLPRDTGLAFVLVQHLDAHHQSILPDLVQNYTAMPVVQVQDNTTILANRVYIIPPNHHLDVLNGVLHLMNSAEPKSRYYSIDHFFRSLAHDQGDNGACIILSGTGSDGTLGLKAIKEAGGMVMVQEPASAKFDGMPKSAVDTGLCDYVLPPEQMANVLVDFFNCKKKPILTTDLTNLREIGGGSQLDKIFVILRAQSGHDFSLYKENTILRRVERRMSMLQIRKLSEYVAYLQENSREVMTLFRDLLIGVSNFFRDGDGFVALEEKVIGALCENRPEDKPIRVWVPGCSSGEEAYSIAILLREAMDRLGREFPVQIFATDIDERAIEVARSGLYPDTIATDVSGGRLRRYFAQEGSHYRIKRNIRDMLVIAVQNVAKDPPFSNLDLISCRNVLIYMGPALQGKVFSIFHYALEPTGFLFLGSSESTGDFGTVFAMVDRKWKIYQHKPKSLSLAQNFSPTIPANRYKQELAKIGRAKVVQKNFGFKELMEDYLLNGHSPTCLLVNDQYDVMYIHGKTGLYLEATSGEVHWNVMKLARQGLSLDLASALRKVKANQEVVRHDRLKVRTNGHVHLVNLIVEPVVAMDALIGWSWVVFEDLGVVPHRQERPEVHPSKADQRLLELEKELKSTKENLQATFEELESSNEEFKSMNEELQASNEELQSANEELETAKEESQSINEELATINAEYEEKLHNLAKANNDMVNLMASTEIGTIFLDEDLKVVRFTPAATRFVNLIPGDIGRPIRHLVSNLKGGELSLHANRVLESLIPVEFETRTEDGQWFSIRVRPYRTVDNVIEGVVIAFVDISDIKTMQESLLLSEERFKVALKSSPLAIVVANVDLELRYTWIYNPQADFKASHYIGKRDDEMDDNDGIRQLVALKKKVLESGKGEQEVITFPAQGGVVTRKVSAEPLRNLLGQLIGVTTAAIDISDLLVK